VSAWKDQNKSSLPVVASGSSSGHKKDHGHVFHLHHKTSPVPKKSHSAFETWMAASEETKEGDPEEGGLEDVIVSEDVVIFTQDSDLAYGDDDIEMGV
jgi:hypothetical protein